MKAVFPGEALSFHDGCIIFALISVLNQITLRGNKFPLTFFFNGSINLHCIE